MSSQSIVLATRAAVIAVVSLAVPQIAVAQMNDKWVTIVVSEEPATLDGCYMNSSSVGSVVRNNIVETLVEIDPDDGSLTPRLATSWEKINETTWRFKLREGVTFHDGVPFNSETASWGISRTIDTDLPCESRTKTFGELRITGKPVDKYTLDIIGNRSVPILPTRMGLIGLVSPNTDMSKLVLDPVGTGPYRLDNYKAGISVTLSRNENYWGEKPEVEGAKYVWRSESTVRAAMVEVGEADIASSIGIQDATNPDTDYSYPNSETTYLRIEMHRPPLNDIRVRKALYHAYDFAGLHGTVLSKDVSEATQLIGPAVSGHNANLKAFPYDQEKARALLAEARADGVPVDDEILFLGRSGNYPGVEEFSEAVLQMWTAVGFNVKLKMVEVSVYNEYNNKWDKSGKPNKKQRPPIIIGSQHDNNLGDAVFSMYNKVHCDGVQSFVCDETIDKLIAKASVMSGDERTKTWQEIQRRVHEDLVAHVWNAHMVGYSRVGERVNYTPTVMTNTELQLSDITFN